MLIFPLLLHLNKPHSRLLYECFYHAIRLRLVFISGLSVSFVALESSSRMYMELSLHMHVSTRDDYDDDKT